MPSLLFKKMAKFAVIYDENKCIGSAVCEAVCEQFWKVKEDGKAELKGSKALGNGIFELAIEEKDLACNKMAAEGCPPGCMRIKNLETGEEVHLSR